MNLRYWVLGVGVFVLLLLTILASVFGWGLPPSTLATTMVVNPLPETSIHHTSHFHLWRPPFLHTRHPKTH